MINSGSDQSEEGCDLWQDVYTHCHLFLLAWRIVWKKPKKYPIYSIFFELLAQNQTIPNCISFNFKLLVCTYYKISIRCHLHIYYICTLLLFLMTNKKRGTHEIRSYLIWLVQPLFIHIFSLPFDWAFVQLKKEHCYFFWWCYLLVVNLCMYVCDCTREILYSHLLAQKNTSVLPTN